MVRSNGYASREDFYPDQENSSRGLALVKCEENENFCHESDQSEKESVSSVQSGSEAADDLTPKSARTQGLCKESQYSNSPTANSIIPDRSGKDVNSHRSGNAKTGSITPENFEQPLTDNAVSENNGLSRDSSGGTVFPKLNDSSRDKQEISTGSNIPLKNGKRGNSRIPVVVISTNEGDDERSEEELDKQRRALDFGFYEPSRGKEYTGRYDADVTQTDLSSKRVDFKVGGEDETESESSRSSSLDERSEAKFFKRARPKTEYKIKEKIDSDSNDSSDRSENFSRKSYDADKGFVRPSGSKKMSAGFQRSLSAEAGSNNKNSGDARVSFSDENISILNSDTAPGEEGASSNSTGVTGILKKPPSRFENRGSDRSLERERLSPTMNMSEGLRRYRRRSQLSVSSDIPTDIPLKNRHVENEHRNRDNLEFIKRRVSVQELQDEGPLSNEATVATWRSPPSPGHVFAHDQDNHFFPEQNRKYGDLRSPSPMNNGYSADLEDSKHGNESSPTVERIPRNASRESLGERIVIQRELSDEEINECLGNFQPHERHYGMPPSPQDLERPKRVPGISAPRMGIAVTESSGSSIGGRQGIGSNDIAREENVCIEPYVPIRRQHASAEPRVPKANRMNMKRMSG